MLLCLKKGEKKEKKCFPGFSLNAAASEGRIISPHSQSFYPLIVFLFYLECMQHLCWSWSRSFPVDFSGSQTLILHCWEHPAFLHLSECIRVGWLKAEWVMMESSDCTSLVHSVSWKPLSSFSSCLPCCHVHTQIRAEYEHLGSQVEMHSRHESFWRCNIGNRLSFVSHFLCFNAGWCSVFCKERRAQSEWVAAANFPFFCCFPQPLSLLLPTDLVWCLSGGLDDWNLWNKRDMLAVSQFLHFYT